MDERHRTERRVFGSVAGVYDATRPGYPAKAVEWLTGPRPLRVLELGAGTGKLTHALAAGGHDLVATEPSEEMLARLRAAVPATTAARCDAERLPFRAGCFDLVAVGQAFHWFDPSTALPEIARVLRHGGHLALVWNLRDESVPWVRRLSEIIGSEGADEDLQLDTLGRSGLFGATSTAEFRFWQQLDREALLGLVRSRSYIAAMGQAERDAVLRRVSDLYDEYDPGRDGLRMPYRTKCYRAAVVKDSARALDEEPPGGGNLLFDFR